MDFYSQITTKEFWEVAGAMAGIVAIFPLIWKWIRPTPTVNVMFKDFFIGKSNMIALYYLLEHEKMEEVNYLPFLLVLVNESGVDLKSFHILIRSKAKETESGLMPRIRIDSDYKKEHYQGFIPRSDDKNFLELENYRPDSETEIQEVSNEGKRIVFPTGTDIALGLHLSVSKDEVDSSNGEFEVEMFLSFSKKKSRRLVFKVNCFSYEENDLANVQDLITRKRTKKSKNILVKTVCSRHYFVGKTHINDTSPLKVAWFESSRKVHSIKLF